MICACYNIMVWCLWGGDPTLLFTAMVGAHRGLEGNPSQHSPGMRATRGCIGLSLAPRPWSASRMLSVSPLSVSLSVCPQILFLRAFDLSVCAVGPWGPKFHRNSLVVGDPRQASLRPGSCVGKPSRARETVENLSASHPVGERKPCHTLAEGKAAAKNPSTWRLHSRPCRIMLRTKSGLDACRLLRSCLGAFALLVADLSTVGAVRGDSCLVPADAPFLRGVP